MVSIRLFVLICLLSSCNDRAPHVPAAAFIPPEQQMLGLTLVAPPDSFSTNPMPAAKATGATWIAVVPYAFTRPGQAALRYNASRQWWGERPEGVRATIAMASAAGIRVMLKPQVWIPGGWTGTLHFETDAEWANWESGYTAYILAMAGIAEEYHVDLFCIGTEFRNAIARRPAYWEQLIRQVRQVYSGKLVYSANWDDWDQVPFWSSLDFIGLSAYFPLSDSPTPDVEELCRAWTPVVDQLEAFSRANGKPVLFTEFGYLSVDRAAWRNWELERDINRHPVNEKAQANCLEALFMTFRPHRWWAGGFLWKWFPNMRGHEGYPERDYTPQGKLGESVLKQWYVEKGKP